MIVEFKNVYYTIPNGMPIYKNLNLRVFENEYYGVLGKNGAGKSTLIELIMGMRKLESGQVRVFGEEPSSSNREQKSQIFVVTHDIQVPGNIAVKDMMEFYKFFYPNYKIEIQNQLLELFEINPKQKFGSLSTGQKIKALLCAAFAARAKLYLFDEVTAVLDPKSRRNFFKFLKEFRVYHPCSILLATNIAEDLHNSVEKVIFIDDDHRVLVKGIDQLDNLFDDDHTILEEQKDAS